MMTAMILYPLGGKDGIIHVCPWIHEIPSSNGGIQGQIESLMTKKGRAPRDYKELNTLLGKINNVYRLGADKHISLGDGLKSITEIMGNKHTGERMFNHAISAKLRFTKDLDKHYEDDVNFERFINDIVNPFIKETHDNSDTIHPVDISVVCHGYTVRAGCRNGQPHPGLCKYLKEMQSDKDACFKEKITSDVKLPDCNNEYIKLIKTGKNIPNGGVVSFEQDTVDGKIRDVEYNRYSIDDFEGKLSDIYKYHLSQKIWKNREKARDTFKKAIKCLLRNLLYPWRYYSVQKSNNTEQTKILGDGWTDTNEGFCNQESFIDSNSEWAFNSMGLNSKERDMFHPFLSVDSMGKSMRRVSKKPKPKRATQKPKPKPKRATQKPKPKPKRTTQKPKPKRTTQKPKPKPKRTTHKPKPKRTTQKRHK